MKELSIIQKTFDLIRWYIPILNRLPRQHRFCLGDRVIRGLYDLLEGLIDAKYSTQKRSKLSGLNTQLELLRYQTRLLHEFDLISVKRYEYASLNLRGIGVELGGWLKQQQQR